MFNSYFACEKPRHKVREIKVDSKRKIRRNCRHLHDIILDHIERHYFHVIKFFVHPSNDYLLAANFVKIYDLKILLLNK